MIEVLIVVIATVFVCCLGVIGLLRFLGVDIYPKPKFPCKECEQLKKTKNDIYKCQACVDEIDGNFLYCNIARDSRDCWKNARKMNYEQQN